MDLPTLFDEDRVLEQPDVEPVEIRQWVSRAISATRSGAGHPVANVEGDTLTTAWCANDGGSSAQSLSLPEIVLHVQFERVVNVSGMIFHAMHKWFGTRWSSLIRIEAVNLLDGDDVTVWRGHESRTVQGPIRINFLRRCLSRELKLTFVPGTAWFHLGVHGIRLIGDVLSSRVGVNLVANIDRLSNIKIIIVREGEGLESNLATLRCYRKLLFAGSLRDDIPEDCGEVRVFVKANVMTLTEDRLAEFLLGMRTVGELACDELLDLFEILVGLGISKTECYLCEQALGIERPPAVAFAFFQSAFIRLESELDEARQTLSFGKRITRALFEALKRHKDSILTDAQLRTEKTWLVRNLLEEALRVEPPRSIRSGFSRVAIPEEAFVADPMTVFAETLAARREGLFETFVRDLRLEARIRGLEKQMIQQQTRLDELFRRLGGDGDDSMPLGHGMPPGGHVETSGHPPDRVMPSGRGRGVSPGRGYGRGRGMPGGRGMPYG